jgi:hypothetical protein
MFLMWGCPQSDETSYEPTPPAPDAQWANVKVIIDRDCGSCHNGVKETAFTSGAVFKASKAKAKLTGGLMPPPPKTIPAGDKSALLAYLGG